MFQPKLALFALALESSAWFGFAQSEANDLALLLYFLAHAGASALVALTVTALQPTANAKTRGAFFLLAFSAGFAIPLFGFIAVIGGYGLLRILPVRHRGKAIGAIEIPEFDAQQQHGKGFRQVGMRSLLSNTKAPVASRLRALVALQNVSGRIASPLLRDVLTDPTEDIRLLAYGMLDNKEKFLNSEIHHESTRLRNNAENTEEHAEAARRLAELYWELVYQELAQGDLRTHALEQSLEYTLFSLGRSPNDAALHLRHGRLLQSLGEPSAAKAAYDRAQELGMPLTRILPYLAEVAFDLRDFPAVRNLMSQLDDWQSLPRLKPIIALWNRK